MEEKILVQSKHYNALFVALGINVFSIVLSIIFSRFPIYHDKWWQWPIIGLAALSILVYFWLRSYSMTVTDKRIYGKVAFGKRVDLPVDSVSSTSTVALFRGVSVATSSGKVSFLLVKNANEIYEAVNKLVIERQQKKQQAVPLQDASDEADQLMKYKKLLDDGVITQEEFNEKKKQLLGL